MEPPQDRTLSEAAHPRTFRAFTYVYPVLSRRSGGISVGINLNPDKACNFDCIYCQVDRSKTPAEFFVGQPKLEAELRAVLSGLRPGGALWSEPEFAGLPHDKRIVTDIAFSGDGEPTTFKNFSAIVKACTAIKEELGFDTSKVVLITNATGLDRPDVKEGLRYLDAHRGEVWAKLDAGTADYFRLVDGTDFPFERVLANIQACGQERSLVIQSCFMRLRGAGPSADEFEAYLGRLEALLAGGAQIHLVQIYTVARPPAYGIVSSLNAQEIDAMAAKVRARTALRTCAYYGQVDENQGLLGIEPAPNNMLPKS
ncbi:MAG: radical SAM protein [Planctomycetes bacterium]|nr:radical SAM protein [Planctomycetota bacterium]